MEGSKFMDMVNGESTSIELSIVMPCLNEVKTLETCICKARKYLQDYQIQGEVIIADNGSTDGSQDIARRLGARLIEVETKGYGAALLGGIAAAQGRFIIMGDSDDSYDLTNLSPFMEKLREGYDLVMGNRFAGGILPGAMPFLHRYLGNPLLSGIGRMFFHIPVGDFHCGLRGFSKAAVESLNLQTTGMEFASEMVIKAALSKQRITEVPTTLAPDGRDRAPHLRTWRDGWRHLRFMLLYSPDWLFMIPGSIFLFLGFLLLLSLASGPIQIKGFYFDVHFMVLGSLMSLLGFQVINLGIYGKMYALINHYTQNDSMIEWFLKQFNLERGLGLGGIIFLMGLLINITILIQWTMFGFGGQTRMREAILAMTLMIIGTQTIFSSFFLSLMGIRRRVDAQ